MKPVLLKAGIPLALSIAGFIYAKIAARRNSIDSFDAQDRHDYGEEILRLSRRIGDLQERECELERRFFRYHDLKEQESVLLELRHELLIEIVRVKYLEEEVLLMEDVNRKVKKILREAKEMLEIIQEKNLDIEQRDEEILRKNEELRMKNDVIIKSNNEIEKLKSTVNQLQEENKMDAECLTKAEHNKLENALEQLKRDRAAKVEELNCLKRESMQSNTDKGELMKLNSEEIGNNGLERSEHCMDILMNRPARSKKGSLIQKLKRFVDKGEKMKGNQNRN